MRGGPLRSLHTFGVVFTVLEDLSPFFFWALACGPVHVGRGRFVKSLFRGPVAEDVLKYFRSCTLLILEGERRDVGV